MPIANSRNLISSYIRSRSVTVAEDNEWRVHLIAVHFQTWAYYRASLGLKTPSFVLRISYSFISRCTLEVQRAVIEVGYFCLSVCKYKKG